MIKILFICHGNICRSPMAEFVMKDMAAKAGAGERFVIDSAATSTKIHRLLDYTARPGDVADPWYTGDFSTTWRDVAEGCRGLLKAIASQAM